MKLAVFADLHLDAPFSWARPEVANRHRQALRDCLKKILEVAHEEKVDALLCAGDLYEHDYLQPDTREFLRSTLGSTPLPTYISPGNHDWYGPQSPYRHGDWSPNVRVFSRDCFDRVELAPGLVLWGAAFTKPTRTESFFDEFRVPGRDVHVALFHGAEMSSAPVQGKTPHAPFRATDVEESGLSHAFVGHYHQPADQPIYTYPGNPDPLTFGENGDRGLVVVDIAEDGSIHRRRRTVAMTAVHDIEVDISACNSSQDVRDTVAARVDGLAGLVRLTLAGELAAEVALDVKELSWISDTIDQMVVRTDQLQPGYDFDAIAEEPTVRGRFVTKVTGDTGLTPEMKRRVLITGLRALAGREDLEVF